MSSETRVRLDVWLDVACVYKTRSQAQKACELGRVKVNGDRGKSHRIVRIGDELRIVGRSGHTRILVVRALADRHVGKAAARELYDDLTPPPTPEEIELRRMQRLSTPPQRTPGSGAPKKQERRHLRRLKEDW